MEKKNRILAVIGLLIVAVGAVGSCLLHFPAGIFCILPSAIPHASFLWNRRKKRNKKREKDRSDGVQRL